MRFSPPEGGANPNKKIIAEKTGNVLGHPKQKEIKREI